MKMQRILHEFSLLPAVCHTIGNYLHSAVYQPHYCEILLAKNLGKYRTFLCCVFFIYSIGEISLDNPIGPLTMIGGTLGCHGRIFGVPKIFFKISVTKSGLWWGERSEPSQSPLFVAEILKIWWGEQSELNQSPIFVADLSETVLNFSFSDNLGPLFVAE